MQWSKCSEEMPPFGKNVLILDDESNLLIATLEDFSDVNEQNRWQDSWRGYYYRLQEVTHWMPLPEIPIVDNNNYLDYCEYHYLRAELNNILFQTNCGENYLMNVAANILNNRPCENCGKKIMFCGKAKSEQ